MSWFFGRRKKKKGGNVNESIQKQRDMIALLEKRSALLDKKIDAELGKAKAAMRKNQKQSARTCLMRKKNYEKQRDRLMQQITNIEQMNMQLEEASMQAEIVNATRQGAQDLRGLQRQMGGVEAIEDQLDSVRETMEDANEISEALGQSIGGTDMEDPDLLDELDMLEQETLEGDLHGLDGLDDVMIPSGPTQARVVPTKGTAQPSAPDPVMDEFAALAQELDG